MEISRISYIKADNNTLINENQIRWIQKINECMEVCSKQNGCTIDMDTNKICKINNIFSYNKLNKYFE